MEINLNSLIKKYEDNKEALFDVIDDDLFLRTEKETVKKEIAVYDEFIQDLKELKDKIKNESYNLEFKNLDRKMKVVLLDELIGKE